MPERKVSVSDLVGASEIAERLDVEVSAVHKWHRRYPDFPAPLTRLRAGLVWAWPDVQTWADRRAR